MPLILPWNIFTPDQTTGLTPLADKFRLLAQSVNDALTSIAGGTTRKVSSATARDAMYPVGTRVAGDSVFRTDLGYVERYYSTYNATTNPGGATPAGWYPEAGSNITGMWNRGGVDTFDSTGRTNVMGVSFPNMPIGKYLVTTQMNFDPGNGGAGNYWVKVDGGDALGFGIDWIDKRSVVSNSVIALHQTAEAMLVAVDVLNTAAGTKTILGSSYISVQYIGPVQ